MQVNPCTFLNAFLPLRIHYKTRELIEEIIKRLKPQSEAFYYGLILAESTVIAIIRNNPKILIIPSGKNIQFKYIKRHQHSDQFPKHIQ